MTEDDQDLLERIEALVANAWDEDEHGTLIEARDRIEALIAENERLREALTRIARLRTDLSGDFSLGSKQSDIARAALGETK